jgi:hypothetical protein
MKNYDIGLVDMVLHLMCYSSSAILIVSLLAYLIGAIVLYVFCIIDRQRSHSIRIRGGVMPAFHIGPQALT